MARELSSDIFESRGGLSRADALRAYFALGSKKFGGPARALGWEWLGEFVELESVSGVVDNLKDIEVPSSPASKEGTAELKSPSTKQKKVQKTIGKPLTFTQVERPSIAPIPFWRPIAREYRVKTGEVEQRPSKRKQELPLPTDEKSSGPTPSTPLIVAEPRLRRRLDSALHTPKPGTELDVDEVVERLSRGDSLTELPRRKNSILARLVLILDPSRRLTPFWDDQLKLTLTLIHRLGAERIRRLPPPELNDRGSHPRDGKRAEGAVTSPAP